MKKRNLLVWLCALVVVSMVLSGCSSVVAARFMYGNGDAVVDEPAPVDDVIDLAPVGDVGAGLAPVDELYVILMESLPATAAVVVQGYLPDGCTSIVDMRMEIDEDAGTFAVTLGTYRDPEAMCTMALVSFEEAIELPILGLPAGTYTVDVNGMTTTFELAIDNVPLAD